MNRKSPYEPGKVPHPDVKPVRVFEGPYSLCEADPFDEHLASKIVATWPEWKRRLLGGDLE